MKKFLIIILTILVLLVSGCGIEVDPYKQKVIDLLDSGDEYTYYSIQELDMGKPEKNKKVYEVNLFYGTRGVHSIYVVTYENNEYKISVREYYE